MLWQSITAICTLLPAMAVAAATQPAFTYNDRQFLLHGKPFVMIGGQMDPQRIHPVFWEDRLIKAKAMGLNTIFIYTFWNMLEPQQGRWASDAPENNMAKFATLAHKHGLKIVLRPGPYVCGEREWGGFPWWLSQVDGMVVRKNNKPFLDASRNYLSKLAQDLKPHLVSQGGPILMVQVENEYGSWDNNTDYKLAMKEMVQEHFDVPLYTTDGGYGAYLQGGYIPGILAEPDGRPGDAFPNRDKYVPDKSSLGPLLDGEFYVVHSDSWGNPHWTTDGDAAQVKEYLDDMDLMLSKNNSFSYYMWHGGTNFGFSTGALWDNNSTSPWTTSYDHGSPLDESGRTNSLYMQMRSVIAKYVPAGSIPEPPVNEPMLAIPKVELNASACAFDFAAIAETKTDPVTMEALGQAYGFVLYEHNVTKSAKGLLQPGDRPRDRVLAFVNGKRQGIIDSYYTKPSEVVLDLQPGDHLQLLIENAGRVNYWNRFTKNTNMVLDPIKGIKGTVTVGGAVLKGWKSRSLPFDTVPKKTCRKPTATSQGSPPILFSGEIWVDAEKTSPSSRDTFLTIPEGIRGFAWANGFNLGRYWVKGAQQSLYLPGAVLKPGAWNKIVVLELEPASQTLTIEGITKRIWELKPDPDAPKM